MKRCGTHSFCGLHYWSQLFTFPCIYVFAKWLCSPFYTAKYISLALYFGLSYVTCFTKSGVSKYDTKWRFRKSCCLDQARHHGDELG